MTTPVTAPAAPRQRATANGPIVGDCKAPTRYIDLMGGSGPVLMKRLLSIQQLRSGLAIMERVDFLPGAECGFHPHGETEEFYYGLDGEGTVEVDGSQLEITRGDLIITPLGATHKVGARPDSNLAILVMEVLPGSGDRRSDPTKISMLERLASQPVSPAGLRIAAVDLAEYFTGAWGALEVAALEPGATLGPRTVSSDAEQILFLAHGALRVDFGEWQEAGDDGLYLVVPPAMPWTVVNESSSPAELVITQIGMR